MAACVCGNQAISAAGSDLVGVVVSLGGKTKDVGPTMLTDGTTNVISAMKRIAPQAKVGREGGVVGPVVFV